MALPFETRCETVNSRQSDFDQMKLDFEAFYPDVVEEIRKYLEEVTPGAPMNRLFSVLEENVPGGKKSRGLVFVNLFRCLKPIRTEKEDQEAYVLAWCIELLQAACLIADDMIDDSQTRRGKPCWFRNENVGRHAINDILFLENIVFGLMDRWFIDSPKYRQMTSLMNETKMQMIVGEDWDSQMGTGAMKWNMFTEEAYKGIVDVKTGYYTFYAPVGLALVLANLENPELDAQIKELMLRFGYLFQIQDDYLDCFGQPEVTGKVGTDIVDRKCTWLAVKALENVSPDQDVVFKKFYGRRGSEEIIKNLYEDLEVPTLYQRLEKEQFDLICDMIRALPSELPQAPFFQLLSTIMGRKK